MQEHKIYGLISPNKEEDKAFDGDPLAHNHYPMNLTGTVIDPEVHNKKGVDTSTEPWSMLQNTPEQISDPLPLIATSTQVILSENVVSAKHTLTFTGKLISLPTNNGGVQYNLNAATTLLQAEKAFRKKLTDYKWYEVKLTYDEQDIAVFANCKLVSISFDSGNANYTHYSNYTLVFESTQLGANDLEFFESSYEINSSDEMGYVQGGYQVTQSHLVGTASFSSRSVIADKAAEGIYGLSSGSTFFLAGDSRVFNVKNIKNTSSSINPTDGSANLTQSFILVPNDMDQTLLISTNHEIDQPSGGVNSLTISGNILGLSGDTASVFDSFNFYNIAKNSSLLTGFQVVRPPTLPITDPRISSSINVNFDGTGSYSVSYELGERYRLTNTIYERINISHSYSKPVVAITPVIGKMNGPLLTSLETRTENTKTMSIDARFRPGKNLYSEWDSFQQLLIDEIPDGDVQFESSIETSEVVYEGSININVSWIHTDSYITLTNNRIQENSDADTIIGIFDVYDMWNGINNINLVYGFGAYNNDNFSITSGSGSWELKASQPLNYEQKSTYVIRVRANITRNRDLKTFNYYGVFRIYVNDVNESNSESGSIHLSRTAVYHGQPAGTIVGYVTYADPERFLGHRKEIPEIKVKSGKFQIINGNQLITTETFVFDPDDPDATEPLEIEIIDGDDTVSDSFDIEVLR